MIWPKSQHQKDKILEQPVLRQHETSLEDAIGEYRLFFILRLLAFEKEPIV